MRSSYQVVEKNHWIIQTMRGAPEFRFKVLPVPKGRNCPKSRDEKVIEIGNVGNKRRSALFCFHVGELLILQPEIEKSGWFHLQLHSFDPWIPMVNWRELWLLCRWVCHTFTGRKKAENDQNVLGYRKHHQTRFPLCLFNSLPWKPWSIEIDHFPS